MVGGGELAGGLGGRLVGWLGGWFVGWGGDQLASSPAGWLAGWLAGRRESADLQRLFNRNKRFMKVLSTFLMDFAPRAVRGIKNMQKHAVKRNILIK